MFEFFKFAPTNDEENTFPAVHQMIAISIFDRTPDFYSIDFRKGRALRQAGKRCYDDGAIEDGWNWQHRYGSRNHDLPAPRNLNHARNEFYV